MSVSAPAFVVDEILPTLHLSEPATPHEAGLAGPRLTVEIVISHLRGRVRDPRYPLKHCQRAQRCLDHSPFSENVFVRCFR